MGPLRYYQCANVWTCYHWTGFWNLKKLHPETHVEVFKGMNHGQLLIDHPDEVAERILDLIRCV